MKACGTNTRRGGYKLAQLCQAADFHPSTVHYYVKIGLLHKPRKIGLGLYLYDDAHLSKLNKIRTLRDHENLSLSKIKDRLQGDSEVDHHRDRMRKGEASRSVPAGLQEIRGTQQAEATRRRLLDVATELFSRKGYEGTTISDITRTLDMSKGSFYLYFRDKRELFTDCIERMTHVIEPEGTGEEISRQTDYIASQTKWTAAFLEAFPPCAGILNIVKIAAMGEDPGLAKKAREAIASIVKWIVRDFRKALAEGIVREVDEEFFAHVVLAVAENVGYKRMTEPNFDVQQCIEKYMDIIARGVLPRAVPSPEPRESRRLAGKITDVKGETVKVREISFGGKPYLAGRIGDGEVRVDTERIALILQDHTRPECPIRITMKDGEKTNLELDGNMILSAASSVGLYTVPFRRVRSISFE